VKNVEEQCNCQQLYIPKEDLAMDIQQESLKLHRQWKGKIEVVSRVEVKDKTALSLAYTPGVAEPCLAIKDDVNRSYDYTRRWNLVAVITDGSAVLGLGDIGPEAGMPVMEGKCVLFKVFADVDAFPICIKSRDVDEIVNTIKLISGSFGGINLEDISAPRCFEIEKRLKAECDIPVFHDDQHGTAVVTLAALINALKITGRDIGDVSVVINGSGAAGIAVTRLLLSVGLKDVVLCDRMGAIYSGRDGLNSEKADIATITNPERRKGSLKEVIAGADVFIGLSGPGLVTGDMVRSMARDPIIFAMANPIPEIMPDEAREAGARVIGTGRSDFPNQINNVLAFPGIFRGALDVRARDINNEMKIAAAYAIASLVSDDELSEEYILPAPFDTRVGKTVAAAVAEAARKTGAARI
jgi:malate dehydrogenase (oxaloacetate-decarboxylating)